MMKLIRIKILYFSLSFIAMNLILCTLSHSKLININEKDDGSIIKMIKGDTLGLVLKTNPSTGYEWKIVSLDTSLLAMIHSKYIANKVRKNIVGSGGKTNKLFKAVKKGQSNLSLIYHRPFEEEGSYNKKFTVTVIIQ
jgi:inhibitor of cysteine peptidase